MDESKLVLFDGHSILNRAYYGVPVLTASDGTYTNAIYGFVNIMLKILSEENADHAAVAFDLHVPTFRHKMFPEYKGTRKPMPQELSMQTPILQDLLNKMGIPVLTLPGYEADDILGTLSKRMQAAGKNVTLVSGDRDLLQLVDDHILVRLPKTTHGTTQIFDYTPEKVAEEYGVTPAEFVEMKALMGDSSDNIPGVPSIGPKTASALIARFHNLESIYADADSVKPPRAKKALEENKDQAFFSRDLSRIMLDAPVEFSFEDAYIKNPGGAEAIALLKKLELKSLVKRLETFSDKTDGAVNALETPKEENAFMPDIKRAQDISEAKAFINAAFAKDCVGISVQDLKENGLSLFLAAEKDCVWELPVQIFGGNADSFFKNEFLPLWQQKKDFCLACMDLKAMLKKIPLPYDSPVYDVKIAAYMLNPLKSDTDAEDICREYLKLETKAVTDREKAAMDAYAACFGIGPALHRLEKENMLSLYTGTELPLIFSLDRMEKAGVRVKKEELAAYGEKLSRRLLILEKEIYAKAGEEFNINSPKQLGEVLFEHLKLPHGKKTKTGYSTAADVLEKLAENHPIIHDILEYRTYSKLYSTYAQGLYSYIQEDGRIHGIFNQTATATGRLSSTEPNLQNIPVRLPLGREIRRVFVPEDGFVFLDADYSQVELRIMAHLSGDERLISAFASDADIHSITASEVFGVPVEEVTAAQRRQAKAVNFGIIYGISAFGLGEDLNLSRKDAADYIARYFRLFPKVKAYLDSQVAFGREHGFVRTMFGRKRPIPEFASKNFATRSFAERAAMNSPIQGTAADIMKMAMVAVDRELEGAGLKSRVVLQIHDELLVETKNEELEQVKEILIRCMENAARLSVALKVQASLGQTWYDAK